MSNPPRQSAHSIAAHTLLDAVISYDDLGSRDAMNLAARRVTSEAVGISEDGQKRITVYVSALISGAIVLLYVLASHLAQARGVSIEKIVADLRETFDGFQDL